MYRPLAPQRRRPVRFLGEVSAQPSPWPVLIGGGLVLGLGLGLVAYMGTRTAQMRTRSRRLRRWG